MPNDLLISLNTTYTTTKCLIEDLISPRFLTLSTIVWSIVLCAVVVLWYYLFWKPFDWFRDLNELGNDEINRFSTKEYKTEASKRNAINSLRARRKLGDLPPIYPNGWFVILESDQLRPRSAKEVNMLGEALVVWRGESGKSYVADAYCPHLGANLGVGGSVSGECIKCPFHGWTFHGADGKLTNIPYSDSMPEFAKIKMWTSLETNGFIYIWYHAEGTEPTWFPASFPQIDTGAWKYRGRSEFRVGCHIQEIPENGADMSHLNVLHQPAIMCGGEPEFSWLSWDFVNHVWDGTWRASEVPGEEHISIMNLRHEMFLLGKIPLLMMNVEVKQIGPGTVSLEFDTAFGKGVLFHMVTPMEPLVQRVLHRFYSASTLIHPYAKLILLGEAIMIERDVRIWNRKMFVSRPLLTKEDKMIKSFRRWYSQFYSENSPRHYFSKSDSINKNKLDF